MDNIDQLDKVLGYLYSVKPQRKTCNEIRNAVFEGDKNIQVDEIMNHLGDDRFVELFMRESRNPGIQGIFPPRREFSISIKGQTFFEKAKVRSRPYFSDEQISAAKKSNKKIENAIDTFVKWVFPAIALILSVITILDKRSETRVLQQQVQQLQQQINDIKDSLKGKPNPSSLKK